ncbi:MAG: hypothetical protein HYV63_05085 [Candidatus Schekmanbacteria bacterium]|nr:hypothetical protein [Candidatus Schekmanbacteria bacterium]
MGFKKVPVNRTMVEIHRRASDVMNNVVRSWDNVMGAVGLGGRRADYDDLHYEFVGGAKDELRMKHYDKSLRLLWKAEQHAPWSSFRDCSKLEKNLADQAEKALNKEESLARQRLTTQDFRALLDREYTLREKQAMVAILSAIGHGEAYAWLVSSDVLRHVKSSGAKASVTMQVLEEAKHFVVMRELVHAFGVPVPPFTGWEYILLEQILRARWLEKFFGMNIVVEGIALSIFGMIADFPGMEVLRLFHLDESRHTALPVNYFAEFPMTRWEKINPLSRFNRIRYVLPAVPLVFALEDDLAELGIDAFAFGGSILRKILHLSERAGFLLPLPGEWYIETLNAVFNGYCYATRPNHAWQRFQDADTTVGADVRKVEEAIFA